MNERLLICLAFTLLFFTGCVKNNESSESISPIKEDNILYNQEDISQIEEVSEDGSVIQNAKIPLTEGEGIDIIQSVHSVDNLSSTTMQQDTNMFFRAIYDNNTKKLNELLQLGFDINTMNANGENAVSVAIASGSYNVLQYLIDNGANLNSTSDTGIPPLSQAILEYNKEAIDILLNSKNIDMYYVWGEMWTGSPLYIACSKANVYALEKMVEHGVDLNHNFSEYNAIPLMHYALSYSNYLKNEEYKELIAFLILNKIDINAKNALGETPLMVAVRNIDIDAFNALIAGGADITLKDNSGKTALDYAKSLKIVTTLPDVEYNKIINLLSSDVLSNPVK